VKQIKDMFNNLAIDGTKKSDANISGNTADIINILFQELTYILPAFRQAWPTQADFDAVKRLWTNIFIEQGLNDVELIRRGLKKLIMSKKAFVPTVGEFIALCREKDDQPLAPYHKEFPALEKQDRVNPETAKTSLHDIRKMLGIKQ
jgi:Replication protein P/Loader and inhibitor of phage G40P